MRKRKAPKQTPIYDVIAELAVVKCEGCGKGFDPRDDEVDAMGAEEGACFCPYCTAEVWVDSGNRVFPHSIDEAIGPELD